MLNKKAHQILLFLLTMLLVAACSQRSIYGYTKPGATADDFYDEFRLCELQNVIFTGRLFFKRREECMVEEGWRLSKHPRAFKPSDYTRPDGRLFPPPPIPLLR